MDDATLLILLLLVALLLLWLLLWGPKAQEARAERERQAAAERLERQRREAEERARLEAERTRLQGERDALLKSIRKGAPDFILKARLEFEREYRSSGGDGMFGQEMSPLVCFGYRVGKTNGRAETERRAILEYAVAADYDVTLPFLPTSYREDWGSPLSVTRFNRIYQHLNNMADLRDGRRNFEVAVSHWRADASWFQLQQRPRVEKYRGL